MTTQLLELAVRLPAAADVAARLHVARLAGRLGYSAIHVSPGESGIPGDFAQLIEAAGNAAVVLDDGALALGIVRSNDPAIVRAERLRLDAESLRRPLIVDVPVAIGRTMNEAQARADREATFTGDGHPQVSGIFGTFEQAQVQVLALARAGADVLLVTVPLEIDIADLLAQVRALVVGATPALLARGTA